MVSRYDQPPIKIIANITDNFELQEVTLVFVNNQTGIIPFVWTLTGQGVGTAYNYSWNATQWEISNATKNISSAIVFNIGYPDSNFPALGEQLACSSRNDIKLIQVIENKKGLLFSIRITRCILWELKIQNPTIFPKSYWIFHANVALTMRITN